MPNANQNYLAAVGELRTRGESLVREITEGRFETVPAVFGAENIPLAPEDTLSMLDREELSSEYLRLFGEGGVPAGDHRSLVAQSDLLASLEKATRARYRGRVVNMAHAASRSKGNTSAGGLFNEALLNLPIMEA